MGGSVGEALTVGGWRGAWGLWVAEGAVGISETLARVGGWCGA